GGAMRDVPSERLPEWTDEELALWQSARDDRPPARSLRASLHAVGVGGAIMSVVGAAETAPAGAGSVAKTGGVLGLLKWGGIVVIGGAVAVGGGAIYRHARSASPAAVAQ